MEYEYHSLVSSGEPQAMAGSRRKREVRSPPALAREIGAENNRGTNIQHVALDRSSRRRNPQGRAPPHGLPPRELSSPSSEVSLVAVMGGGAVGLLAVGLMALAVVLFKGKKSARRKGAPQGSGSSEPMMPRPGLQSDSSEV